MKFTIFANNKLLLAKIVLASVLIAAGTTSLFIAYNIKSELDSLATDKIQTDAKLQELKKKTGDFITELVFAAGLLALSGNMVKNIFFKSDPTKIVDKSVTAPKLITQIKPAIEAKKRVFFYIVLLPCIHGTLLLFGGNILNLIYHNSTTFDEYNQYVFLTGFPFWIVVVKFYLSKWTKLDAKKYFELHGYDYVITERQILEKIKKISAITVIITLTILIIYGYIDQTPKSTTNISIYQLIAFSISYTVFEILIFSYYKINEQEKKKNFKLFLAASFFNKALESEGKLKVKHLTEGLSWYSLFFRKVHKQFIGDVDKICLVLLSKKSSTQLIQKLIQHFESGEEYAAINEITKLMKTQIDNLFTKYTLFQKLREWSGLGIIIAIVQLTWGIVSQTILK